MLATAAIDTNTQSWKWNPSKPTRKTNIFVINEPTKMPRLTRIESYRRRLRYQNLEDRSAAALRKKDSDTSDTVFKPVWKTSIVPSSDEDNNLSGDK